MLFGTIVCGVDGSDEGFEALAQARRLLAPGGRLVAVTACDDTRAVHAGAGAPRIAAALRAEAEAARERAERELAGLPGASAVVVRGRAVDVLRRAVQQERPDLLAVGSHGTGRAAGMLLGSVATTMLHEAPCPVLVARRADDPASFPRRIAVGADGRPASEAARAVAAGLGDRLGAPVHVVSASDAHRPLAALEAASADADLLVVGSRGLHGLAALRSVSERIAHRAHCSVLVVRPTGGNAGGAADERLVKVAHDPRGGAP